jgi:uncharacterized iron-regulated membrane protein
MKKLHKLLGYIMLLPFIAWFATGIFFFFKPGYKEAYQALPIKQYVMDSLLAVTPQTDWLAVKQLKTVLGHHLLVQTENGWKQLDPLSLAPLGEPSEAQIKALVTDAIKTNRTRYGEIATIDGNSITTSTQVRISLNWHNLSLYQQGKDTDFINQIYDIHYLRWTGNKTLDQYLGVIGLSLVLLLALLGLWLSLKKPTRPRW